MLFTRSLQKICFDLQIGQSNRQINRKDNQIEKLKSSVAVGKVKKEKLYSTNSSPQLSYFFIWLSAFPETWNIRWLKTGVSDDKGKSECQTRTTLIMIFFPWLKDNLFSSQNLKYLDINKLHPLFMSFLPLHISLRNTTKSYVM